MPPPGNNRTDVLETIRRIKANDPEYNSSFNYANNFIKTSKYTLLTFLPRNLFEQFQRLANFYFLCLLVLQLIPAISSLTPVTTALPLVGVLALTAAKDAYDDIQRHRSDSQVNNRKSMVLRDGRLVEERWHKVRVGDVIRMEDDQFVAADILLLSTSEPNGLCYIETAELDGETNLKCKQCLMETEEMGEEDEALWEFDGEIECEPPNNNLSKFEGTLNYKNERFALDNDKVLLRGCILRNTAWCYGLVLFAGKDTKLMQNSGKTKFKRTSIDRLLNFIIIGIVFFLLALCLFCTIACGIFESLTGRYFQDYLPWDPLVPTDPEWGATVIALLVFFSYAIVLNTVVPISLYVSVEVIRLVQSMFINWDLKMYYEPSDTPARARTTTLNEELGQIEYIFSDKTGTLTQNIMTFNKCAIAGKLYGEVVQFTGIENKPIDFSSNPRYEPSFKFFDKALYDAVNNGNENAHNFFRLLALCHTVMAEEKDGKLDYQAQSPDEEALVSAARNFGFVFLERTPNSITIEVKGQREVHELLCILDFNNVRKRMSVILKHEGKIRLYCKGADSVIYERLKQNIEDVKSDTTDHLNDFASEGLRTLCLAHKDLDEAYFHDWKRRHHEASVSMENREDKLDEIYEEIENDLMLLGATAIEDKLQDGVPKTIANLALAGIKIWVLTGDKQETAINIGYSCQLLTDDMVDIFIVDGLTFDEVENQLRKYQESIRSMNTKLGISVVTFSDVDYNHADTFSLDDDQNGGFALVIQGASLTHALSAQMESLFIDVACQCKAVIGCRLTPLQKAMIVDLVKKYKSAVTLSIGDGANDVSMIKTAHIGVGISGQEGMQAVLASDFSLAQFRFLERLLLVHGRWSYLRMCKFLRYFFYKNFAFTLVHFWYAFFCGFSAQTVYEPFFISCYNMFYTSLPVLALGVLDRDTGGRVSVLFPKLYTPGLLGTMFTKVEFMWSAVQGLITSFLLFYVPYGSYNGSLAAEGFDMSDHELFGSIIAILLIIVVSGQICLDCIYWTVINHIAVWGSLVWFFLLQLIYYKIYIGGFYVGFKAMGEATFWFTLFLTLIVLLIPVVAWRFYFIDIHPTLSDKIRYKEKKHRLRKKPRPADILRTPTARRSRRSIRSGYAFAHQEGFGKLITSGKILRRKPPHSGVVSANTNRTYPPPSQNSRPSTQQITVLPNSPLVEHDDSSHPNVPDHPKD